jgi:acetylornithine deacetylase/succinyl-diaminopimelate desuccinylase-like protein
LQLLIALLWALPFLSAQAPASRPGEAAFRELYKELIEINTTLSVGSCTAAAEAMSVRLKAAGLPAGDIQILVPPDRPKDGNLIATLRGQDRQAKPLLLLAHIDVVEAKREDWVRDPFTLGREFLYEIVKIYANQE